MNRSPLEATSAYYRAMPGVGALRLALGAFDRLWPALAVRAACRLFLTPLPPKFLNRRKPWTPGWRIDNWRFEDGDLTVYSMAAAGPVVLLVHGWGGHAGQMRPLAEALAACKMQPVIIEMPGHGRSAGWQSNMPQFARAIEYVSQRFGQLGDPVQAVVAHSLGASAAAYAVGRGAHAAKLVLVAPAASAPAYTRMFAQVFGLSERTRAGLQRRIEELEGALMAQFEAGAAGTRVRVPTLVIHDRGDAVNQFTDGEAYANAIDGALMHATEGLGHRAILKDPDVIRQIVAFASIGDRPH
jgi:pimeloyl-ACP methyl ester carboxylesterase